MHFNIICETQKGIYLICVCIKIDLTSNKEGYRLIDTIV